MRTRILMALIVGIVLLLAGCGQQASDNAVNPPGDAPVTDGESTLVSPAATDSDFWFSLNNTARFGIGQGGTATINLSIMALSGYTGTTTLTLSLADSSATHLLPPGLQISPTTIQMVNNEWKTYTLKLSVSRNTPLVKGRYVNLVAKAADGRAESVYFVLDVRPYGFAQIDTTLEHTCGLTTDGKAYCWGEGGNGQLGNGNYSGSNLPVAVRMPIGVSFSQISTGGHHTCAIGSNAKTYCWGTGQSGRLGNGSLNWFAVPVEVSLPAGVKFTSVQAGMVSTCAIGSNQKAYCWGNNEFGQLGNGTTSDSNIPVAVSLPEVTFEGNYLIGIDVGGTHACVSDRVNTYCWGEGNRWQFGNGGSSNSSVPVEVNRPGDLGLFEGFKKIVAGLYYTCGLASFRTDHFGSQPSRPTYYCWGNGSNGQLGNGTNNGSIVPSLLPSPIGDGQGSLVASSDGIWNGWIAASYRHTCAGALNGFVDIYAYPRDLNFAGDVYCWGEGFEGQLGDGLRRNSNVSVKVVRPANSAGFLTVSAQSTVAVGDVHSCAITVESKAYCWGRNHKGQLGTGSFSNSNVPVPVVMPQ